ncbi:MAG: hypothetical protein IJM62_05360 [Lachnospiraceae bacterium]|nr:hypothetical protein [Lachnospiraceae bacterium]
MKKRSVALFISLLITALLLFGCGKKNSEAESESGVPDSTEAPETGHGIPDDVFEFIDSGVEENIRASLGKPEGFITEEDVKEIETLMLYNISSDIVELTDLPGLPKLKELGVYSDTVTDITALKHTALVSLTIESSGLTDITALSDITTLEELRLERCGIKDISALTGLKGLKMLSLAGCEIEDLTPLLELEKLEKLDLRGVKAEIPQELLDRGIEILTD